MVIKIGWKQFTKREKKMGKKNEYYGRRIEMERKVSVMKKKKQPK
jgi:Txe/YoeB family toxin of Txe-Axe toxin-antitoxin module